MQREKNQFGNDINSDRNVYKTCSILSMKKTNEILLDVA